MHVHSRTQQVTTSVTYLPLNTRTKGVPTMWNITNHKPSQLEPTVVPAFVNQNPQSDEIFETFQNDVFTQLDQPLRPGLDPQYVFDGQPEDKDSISETFVTELFLDEGESERSVKLRDFLAQTLLHYQPNFETIDTSLMVQNATAENLPLPIVQGARSIVYTVATDVIPVAKQYLAGQVSFNYWATSFGFTFRVPALVVSMDTPDVYKEFQQYVQTTVAPFQSQLPIDASMALQEFYKTTLDDLAEGFRIRATVGDNNQDYSFARILHTCVMQFVAQNGQAGIIPTSLKEIIHPTTIMFLNVEKHAHSNNRDINKTWNSAMNMSKAKLIGLNKIKKLSEEEQLDAMRQRSNVRRSALMNKAKDPASRKKRAKPFGKQLKTSKQLTKEIVRILSKMKKVRMSNNVIKTRKTTFNKPNRRDPDNYDKPGIIYSHQYVPDIHVYLDTSGSISERNYKEACMAIIQLAQTLKTKLYLNSFSHVLSQPALVDIGNCSKETAWKRLQNIPKVSGGTDFDLVWDYIHQSSQRKQELAIMITDFEYTPSNSYTRPLPQNLFYVPCGGFDIDKLRRNATYFVNSTRRLDANLRHKIIF